MGRADTEGDLAEYVNVPPTIGMAVSSGKATMAELATVLTVEDLHDILEIIAVDAHNQRVLANRRKDR